MTRPGISPDLLAVETDRVAALLHQMVDLVMVVGSGHRIIDVSVQDEADLPMARQWCNQPFVDLVCPESRGKCAALFAEDAARPKGKVRWRHLNLRIEGGEQVPYLMKYAHMPTDAGIHGLILARDLRPLVEMRDHFQRATTEMEQRYEALIANRLLALHDAGKIAEGKGEENGMGREAGQGAGAQRIGATIVQAMVSQISHRSLEQIVAETTGILERLCITEAVAQSSGDRQRAAQILGITVEALNRKMLI